MATRNLTLEENFICHHFGRIYDLICSGLSFQEKSWYKWNIEADKQEVMESIRLFFHLCLNAGKVGNEFQEIEEWVMALAKIACAQRSHGIVSSYKYRVLRNASDPITKFLFGCFDWHIDEINPEKAGFKDNRILDSFDARLRYYQEHVSYRNPESGNTANLLFAMKKQRNQSAHTAISFYANRQKCLKELVNHLLNYIMVFHMIRTECREEEWNKKKCVLVPIRIKEDIKTLVCLPESTTTISITVECVEEKSGNEVAERKKDVRLFRVSDSGLDEVLHEADLPGRFKVTYFNDYVIYIMTEGQMSNPSEKMLIEHDFVDGTVVRVNIPPKGTPQPEKISIRELILYSEKDLPDDVKYLLGEMEHYAQKDEYARMARSLVLASATNSERDYRNYLEAVRQTRESLATEIANRTPCEISELLRSKMEEIQAKLAEPYQNGNFADLCNSIDELYDELGVFAATDDNGLSAVEQIGKNIADFLDGQRLTIGTKSTDIILRQHREIAKLEMILSKAEEYPEVIEAEFGKSWLQDRIEYLYVDQINYYMRDIIPLSTSIDEFRNYLKANADRQTEDGQRTLEYVELLYAFINDQPENIIRLVITSYEILLFLLDNCIPDDKRGTYLKEETQNQLIQLKDKFQLQQMNGDHDLRIPMTSIENLSEYEELKTALEALNENMALLRNRICQYHQEVDKIYQKVLARRKEEYSRLTRLVIDWKSRPQEEKDIRSEVRFECLVKIFNTRSPELVLQLICNSPHTWSILQNLFECSPLGIDRKGLYEEWDAIYKEWIKGNEEILETSWNIVTNIDKKFSSRKKKREYNDIIPHQTEIDELKASRILEYQKKQIEFNYGGQVPDYIRDIMNAHESFLPIHVKAQFLKKVLKPSKYPTENILFLIDEVLRYWYHSSQHARISFLDKYVTGDYSKLILSSEAQTEFKDMTIDSQRLYLEILMNQPFRIGSVSSCKRFLMAYRMNFQEGTSGEPFVPEKDFFLLMTKFHMEDIWRYDLQEFLDSCKIIELITNYVEWHQDDTEAAAQAIPQIEHFFKVCRDYYVKHLNPVKIEEGKRPLTGFLEKVLLRQEIKEKSPIEQLIAKYESLYRYNDTIIFKSGWCEVEQEIFNEITKKIGQESPKVQEEMCRFLWLEIYRLPYNDVMAERLNAMKLFCSKEKHDLMLQDFYTHCVYGDGKISICNPSALSGLETIRDLFAKYGQDVKVPFNGESTAFVEILIRLYKMFQNGAFNDQEIKVTIRTDT